MKEKNYKSNGRKLLATGIIIGFSISHAGAAILYPDMPVFEPTTIPVSFAAFDPGVDINNTPDADAPEIAEWTRQNNPGDTIALTAEGIDGEAVHFALYGGSVVDSGLIQRIDGRAAAVTLPETLPVDDVYLMWPGNANGFGTPVAINKAESWWCDNLVAENSMFRVYGQSLELDGTSHLYIEELDEWISTTNCNPYMAQYTLPESATTGTYTLYAHNGHGQKYGWSEPLSIAVWAGVGFSDTPDDWYDVTDYGVVGDGVTDDLPALKAMWSTVQGLEDWPTIYFPAGTYHLGGTSRMPIWENSSESSGVRFMGAGMDSVILDCACTDVAGTIRVSKDNVTFKDLTIRKVQHPDKSAQSKCIWLYNGSGGDFYNAHFDNVMFDDRLASDRQYNRKCLDSEFSNVTFYQCNFTLNVEFYLQGDNYTFDQCDFRGVFDCGGYMSCAVKQLALIDCTNDAYDNSDATIGDGWQKGRWLTSGANHASINWYIGGNVSSNAMPRYPPAHPVIDEVIATSLGTPYVDPDDDRYYFQTITLPGVTELAESVRADTLSSRYWDPRGDGKWKGWGFPIVDYDKTSGTITIRDERKYWDYYDPVDGPWYKGLLAGTPSAENLLSLVDGNDWNAGEQFMKEGGEPLYRGRPTTVAPTTLMLTDLSSSITHSSDSLVATIVGGRGLGQSRRILSISGNNITLENAWLVAPDTDSIITIGQYVLRWALYNNRAHSDLTDFIASGSENSASAGFQLSASGGANQCIMDSNIIDGAGKGVMFELSGSERYDTSIGVNEEDLKMVLAPAFFVTIKNNTFVNVRQGIADSSKAWVDDYNVHPAYDDPIMLGGVIRNNTFDGVKENVFGNIVLHEAGELTVWDQNVVSNMPIGSVLDRANYKRNNDVWVGNAFVGNGTGSGLELVGNPIALRDNTFSGFTASYTGTLPGEVMEIPVRVTRVTTTGSVPVWNSGTSLMSWTATEASPWLELTTSSGTVTDENDADLIEYRVIGTPTVGDQAVIEIIGSGKTRTVTVVYEGGNAVAAEIAYPVDYPLSGYGESPLRAIVYDVDTEQTFYVYDLENLNQLRLSSENLKKGHSYRWWLQQQSGTSWIDVGGEQPRTFRYE